MALETLKVSFGRLLLLQRTLCLKIWLLVNILRKPSSEGSSSTDIVTGVVVGFARVLRAVCVQVAERRCYCAGSASADWTGSQTCW